jgi:uncharacterized protein
MPKVEQHAPGMFCWVELSTSSQESAKQFYSGLFGWTATDYPTGPDGHIYTIFSLNGADTAATYTASPEERAMVPPHWNLYVTVESADDAAARAAELGGRVVAGPFDAGVFGRMAVIQDPTGTALSVWQAHSHPGTAVEHESGTFCWADLSTPDPERAKIFYEALFGWQIAPDEKYPPDYLVIKNSGKAIGGVAPAAFRSPDTPPHWMLFFMVADADAVTAKVKELGGAVMMTAPGGMKMSVVADPQGAAFSIIQPPL